MADQRGIFVPFDLDTGGGTEQVLGVALRISGAGGSTEAKGSQVSAISIPVVIASDQAAITVASGATFTVQEDGAALTALQLIDNPVQVLGTDTYLEGTDSAMMAGVVRNDVLATLASVDNEIAPLQVNANGALYTSLTELNNTAVDVNNGSVSAGTQRVTIADDSTGQIAITGSVDTELPAAALLSDTLANPTAPAVGSHLMGYDRVSDNWTRMAGVVDGEAVGALNAGFLTLGTDGANYQVMLMDTDGRPQVDIISGGAADSPTNPVTQFKTTTDLANGASADLDTTSDTAAGKKLAKVEVWSSLDYSVKIHTVDNSVESTDPIAVGGGAAMTTFQYQPRHRDYHILGATAGTDAFRV